MPLKIDQISNIGIIDLKNIDLRKYSLIYGFNGSGKTTLSRLLSILGSSYDLDAIKRISIQNITATCKINNEQFLLDKSETFNTKFCDKVIVFNRDFVEENVFTKSGLNQIVISKRTQELEAKRIAVDNCKSEIISLQNKYGSEINYSLNGKDNKGLAGLIEQKKKLETDIAKSKTTYASQIKGILDGDDYKNYDRTKLEGAIRLIENSIPATKQEIFYQENLSYEILKNEILNKKNEINAVKEIIPAEDFLKIKSLKEELNNFKELLINLENLLAEKVEISDSEIKLLADNIKDWLQKGLKLHQEHKKLDDCLFCKGSLGNRLEVLQDNFGGKYDKVKQGLDSALLKIENTEELLLKFNAVNEIVVEDTFGKAKDDLVLNFKKLGTLIDAKKSKMSEAISLWIPDFTKHSLLNKIELVVTELQNIETLYKSYNKDVDDADRLKKEGYTKLLKALVVWFLENAYENKNYTDLLKKEKQISDKIIEVKNELKSLLTERINHLNQELTLNLAITDGEDFIANVPQCLKEESISISNQAANIKIPMDLIESYFRSIINTDLKLEEHKNSVSGISSFKAIRSNIDAFDILSEGERTALAFAYFLTKLKEDSIIGNNQKIIVIDDPISSLDYNVLYSIYNLIYHELYKLKGESEYKGIIIMTHNWYFANLIHNGIIKKNIGRENKDDEGCFYELSRRQSGKSEIIPGKKNFLENEYNYLFAYILEIYDKIKRNQDVDLYGIGNACRRFAELFCQFYYHDQHLDSLLGQADNGLCRFLHISSHGEIIPDKTIINFSAEECSKNIENLLIIIQSHLDNKDVCKVRTKLKKYQF